MFYPIFSIQGSFLSIGILTTGTQEVPPYKQNIFLTNVLEHCMS